MSSEKASAAPSPRPQFPAPSVASPSAPTTHSRQPGTLGRSVGFKNGVGTRMSSIGSKSGSSVTFGSIDDVSAPMSSPTSTIKPNLIKSFGTVPANPNGKIHSRTTSFSIGMPPSAAAAASASLSSSTPILVSSTLASSSTSTAPSTAPLVSGSSSTPRATKFDVKSLFENKSSDAPSTVTLALPPPSHQPTPSPHTHTSSLSNISSTPPTPASTTAPSGGLSGLNSNANTFTPKRVTIKSESGQEVDLERWKKQQAPAAIASPITLNASAYRAVQVWMETWEEASMARVAREAAAEGKKEVSKAKKKAQKARQKARREAEEKVHGEEGWEVDEWPWKKIGWGSGSEKEEAVEEAEETAGMDEVERPPREVEKARAQLSANAAANGTKIELPGDEVQCTDSVVPVVNEDHDTVSELKAPLRSAFTWAKTRRRPAHLDLQVSKDWINLEAVPSALAKARPIEDIDLIQYPDGIKRPKANLNRGNAARGRFSYDRDFLLQFMHICKDKPDALPPLDDICIVVCSVAQTSTGRGLHGSRSSSGAPSYQPSVGVGISGLRKSHADPFTVTVGSGTALPTRPMPKAGDISKFCKIYKAAPMTSEPSSVFHGDKLKGPESTTTGRGSISMVNGNLEVAPELAVVERSPAQGAKNSINTNLRIRSNRGGAQEKGQLGSRKTDPQIEDDEVLEDPLQALGLAQEESQQQTLKGGHHPAPRRMSEEEANERIDRTTTMLSGLHDISTALAVFQDLPARYHGRLVDRLVFRAVESHADTHAQAIAYFLHCAAERHLCSPTAFEDGVSMTASALDDIAEETPDAVSRYATVIKSTGLHEDPNRRVRVLEKVGIHASSELQSRPFSTV